MRSLIQLYEKQLNEASSGDVASVSARIDKISNQLSSLVDDLGTTDDPDFTSVARMVKKASTMLHAASRVMSNGAKMDVASKNN